MKIAIALMRCWTKGPISPLWSCVWIALQTNANQLLESQVGVAAITVASRVCQRTRASEPGTLPLGGRLAVVGAGLATLSLTLDRSDLGLLRLSGNTHLGDFEDQLVRIDTGRERHAIRQRHLAEADALVDLDQPGNVDVEHRRDVARHAFDLHLCEELLEHAELELGDCRGFANRNQRNLNRQLLA